MVTSLRFSVLPCIFKTETCLTKLESNLFFHQFCNSFGPISKKKKKVLCFLFKFSIYVNAPHPYAVTYSFASSTPTPPLSSTILPPSMDFPLLPPENPSFTPSSSFRWSNWAPHRRGWICRRRSALCQSRESLPHKHR